MAAWHCPRAPQILVHIVTSVIHLILFGYFFSASALDGSSLEDIWPYLVLAVLPAIRLLLIGHWGQVRYSNMHVIRIVGIINSLSYFLTGSLLYGRKKRRHRNEWWLMSNNQGNNYWEKLVFLQVMEQQSRQPFMTICQVSTIDGSPRLERQVLFCNWWGHLKPNWSRERD